MSSGLKIDSDAQSFLILEISKPQMGADWYETLVFYGYSVKLPEGVIYRQYIKELDALNTILPAPIIFTGLLPMFHSRMEGADMDDLDELSGGGTYPAWILCK